MSSFFGQLSAFTNSVAWLLALVFVVSMLHRSEGDRFSNSFGMGFAFSLVVVVSMSDPIILPMGTGIYDMRYLLIGVATGLFGPVAGAMTLATALGYRIWIGGPGVDAAIVGSLSVFALCWMYNRYVAKREIPLFQKSMILGTLISGQLAAMLTVPEPYFSLLMMSLGPYMVGSSFLGALLLNHLLSGELSFLSRAEALQVAANTDPLTGLLNRRGLELLSDEIDRSSLAAAGQALLYFDIDKFKSTNDEYGHKVGDDVLCHVVDHVASGLRHNDIFVRLGGDEFVVVLQDVGQGEAQQIAERCREAVSGAGFQADLQVIPTSVSIGAVWLRKPQSIQMMLQAADRALYDAKSEGRDRVVFRSNLHQTVFEPA